MLDASVDDPVLVNVNSRFHLLTKNYPIILHPEIIVSLVKAWKDLERDYHVIFDMKLILICNDFFLNEMSFLG